MTPFDLDGLFIFWGRRWDDILELVLEHISVVAISLIIATLVGVLIGFLVWNRPVPRSIAIASAGVALTIPSLALLALITPIFGLGWTPTVLSLVFYSLLPIVRNTVVGLRDVAPEIMESARGVGMSNLRILISIQLPIAWPIILTGVRVAAQLTIGIAAIAAYVAGPGLGQYIFQGLSSLGSKNALNLALTGTLGVILLALIVDALFVLITRYTTSRGLRA
ncbi:osmoprotectant transport system permease protein [Rhodoglobus vestalii]|uniref:Osmoprotectant transport system permease protein n=1 Tax=Rhodoglobus vestalii TaxID=193384 RepID=A0A8H2K3Z9_9MICO|nr:ABC transporter permease [Rhodoglobus vestalii]TQO18539.1 osmoprotectant transport system permease protein [Rhodoglobus vestalii]